MKYQPHELFRSTAPYYARYRVGYPPELFTPLAERFSLDGTQLSLDLGCGTGQITIPLAAHVRQVVAGHVEVVDWTWTLDRDLDSVVGLQFSYSYSAPALLGNNADAFAAELRRKLLAANPTGRWTETVRTEAIIATRP